MEISNLQVEIGGQGPTTQDWGWLQQMVRQRKQRVNREQLSSKLSELLFGVALGPDELREYRYSLGRILEILDDFEAPSAPLPPAQIVRPEARTFSVGTVAWQPAAASIQVGEPYAATPTQFFHKRKLVDLQRFFQRSEEQCFHSVSIKLARGLKTTPGGADKILLTPEGLRELSQPSCPPVTVLRLPPRALRQVDVLRVVKTKRR